jgi:hypothetical protein
LSKSNTVSLFAEHTISRWACNATVGAFSQPFEAGLGEGERATPPSPVRQVLDARRRGGGGFNHALLFNADILLYHHIAFGIGLAFKRPLLGQLLEASANRIQLVRGARDFSPREDAQTGRMNANRVSRCEREVARERTRDEERSGGSAYKRRKYAHTSDGAGSCLRRSRFTGRVRYAAAADVLLEAAMLGRII